MDVDRTGVMLDGPILITVSDILSGDAKVIAIPSMGLPLCAASANIADTSELAIGDTVIVSGSVDAEGQIVPCAEETHSMEIISLARDAVLGYEFSYRKGPDGYITLEVNESEDADFVSGLTLINRAEYEEMQNSLDAREGPPAMQLRVYTNPENLHAPVWAMRKPKESNVELAMGDTEEAVVGGANATHYVADGLYPTDTYVVASNNHIYVLTGSYLDKDSAIYKDFQDLVNSFTFIPQVNSGAPQGKLNVQLVCESALTYSTFPTSEEADKFVADCVAGEHPEVIERYISDLGLDGAAI